MAACAFMQESPRADHSRGNIPLDLGRHAALPGRHENAPLTFSSDERESAPISQVVIPEGELYRQLRRNIGTVGTNWRQLLLALQRFNLRIALPNEPPHHRFREQARPREYLRKRTSIGIVAPSQFFGMDACGYE
jgi:hypothetical protein